MKYKLAEITIVFIGVLVSLLGIGLFGGNNAYADDSISLNVSTSNIALDLYSNSASGTFAESSSATITASTTSSSGYTLSIASSTGSTDLTNTTDNTSKITSISSNLTASDFSNSSNTQYNNKWGYKPSQYVTTSGDIHTTHTNTGANAVFKPLPNGAGEILAITDSANATGASDTYTMSIGARVTSDTTQGSYISGTFVIMAVANINQIKCDNTKLCVKYDGNGLTFSQTATQDARMINNVNYNSSTAQQQITKYSHTPNISDAGVQDGNYANSYTQNEVVTIDGASTLHVKLTYGGESASYDWVSFWAGDYPSYTAASNYSTGIQNCGGGTVTNGKYGGTNGTTVECDITGPSVTFAFKSDHSGVGNGYGYYAVVTGTGVVRERTLTSGEYTIPTGAGAVFHGWSSTATTPGAGLPSSVEYADEAAVKAKMPGDNGEAKTLYAVWQQPYPITFTKDSNVASIAVIDDTGATVATITSSGQNVNLLNGDTYTIKPTYNTGYYTNTITKTAGTGTLAPKLPNAEFTVGSGPATINVASRALITFDQVFANAGKTKYNNYYKIQDADSTICSNVDSVEQGVMGEVIDVRDNNIYKIGKLKDGKCWMLDNLALDLYNTSVLNSLSSANTNIDPNNESAILTSLKSGNRSAGDQYATAGPTAWTSGFSYSVPMANLTNQEIPASYSTYYDPMKDTVIANNWKMGGYYNYCAASAGSYCYGDGISIGTPSGDATSSICPKGWRIPTSNTSGEFATLYNAYSGASPSQYTAFRTAFRLPMSGNFDNGSVYYQGTQGYWWSGTRYDAANIANIDANMYSLYANTTNIRPSSYGYRGVGYTLRCVLGS